MATATRAWLVGGEAPSELSREVIDLEKDLETWIEQRPTILEDRKLVIIARQLRAGGNYVDLLGLDGDGTLVVIELKRDMAYRDALAQAIDYASWLAERSKDELAALIDE